MKAIYSAPQGDPSTQPSETIRSGPSPTLKVERLVAGYGQSNVLHSVDLNVHPGEIVAVIGANGAGKTTLLRTIGGLLRVRSGSIALHGQTINTWSVQDIARAGVAHSIEGRGILPNLTVGENILLGAIGRRRLDARQRSDVIEQAIGLFPWISHRLKSFGGQLSGGQQQMVSIARLVASGSALFLIDEPSLGLAPTLVDEIYDAISRLAVEGSATLIVEQHVKKALSVSKRAYVLQRGKVILHDSSESILSDPTLERAYFS